MTPFAMAMLFGASCAAPLNWCAVAGRPGLARLEEIAKPLTLAFLVLAALAADPPPHHAAARTILVAGLVFSLLGDVALLPRIDQFIGGLCAFLLAHIAYVAAGLDIGVHPDGAIIGAVVVVAAMAVLAPRIGRAVHTGPDPSLLGPVLAYMAVISAMVVVAFGTGRPVFAAGAALFYASDAQLAWNRFVRSDTRLELGCIVTYHVGQVLLLVGVLA